MKRLIAAAAAMMICLCSAPVSASSAKAVFDFGDDSFFAVKMQENESVYLELDTTYDKQLSQSLFEQTGMEADRFYRFDTGEQEFLRTGELFLQAEEGQTLYQIEEDGSFSQMEAGYVQDGMYVGKDGKKMSGFVVQTKELGEYVIAE